VIARPGFLLLLVLILWLGAFGASANLEILSVEIQIPGVSQPLRLAPADADAFQRRLNQPPPYVGPKPAGESFIVTSAYWDAALRAADNAPPIAAAAAYFPNGGIVRARQSDRDLYFVLDLRQRALLDRYIRLARTGQIGPEPGALQVLAAASSMEPIGIGIGGRPVDTRLAQVIWAVINGRQGEVSFLGSPQPPGNAPGYWLTFTTSEGRALQYHYDPASDALTDALGTETYVIPAGLPTTPGDPPQIEQQEPHGSKLWWPVMLGGGAALLAAAIWLRRRYP